MRADVGRPLLLAIDGEPHTDAAVARALDLAREIDVPLVAIHVKDPYLKQFASEIYAQGREEYLEHIDEQLEVVAGDAVRQFCQLAAERGVGFEVKVVDGDTRKCLRDELDTGRYGAIIVGGEGRRWFGSWRARSLWRALTNGCRGASIVRVVASS